MNEQQSKSLVQLSPTALQLHFESSHILEQQSSLELHVSSNASPLSQHSEYVGPFMHQLRLGKDAL